MEQDKLISSNQEISIGVTLRHLTSYMIDHYTRTIRELSTHVSSNHKKDTLRKAVKEYYDCVKRMIKFIKNCKKYKKLLRIDQLTAMMYVYKDGIKFVIDDLYYTHEMCKLYRTPSFNMPQGIKTINHSAHGQLKKDIGNALVSLQNFTEVKKEKQFEFIQKYIYNESMGDELSYDKMLLDSEIILDIPSQLLAIQNTYDNSYITFKDNLFCCSFGRLILFKLMPITYIIEQQQGDIAGDNNNGNAENPSGTFLTYYCKEIKFNKTNINFSKEMIEKLRKKYQNKANTMLYNEIKEKCPETSLNDTLLDYTKINLQLSTVKTILQQVISETINPDVFQYLKVKVNGYINKFQLPVSFKDTKRDEEMIIQYHCAHGIQLYTIRLIPQWQIGKILLISSKYIISHSPFIFIDDHEELFSLTQFPYEKLISDCLGQFELIALNNLQEKLSLIQSTFIPFSFTINNNKKIDMIIGGIYLLFSIVINTAGKIQLIDHDFILNESKGREVKELLLEYIDNEMIDSVKFNEIIYSTFIVHYFSFSKMKLRYESWLHNSSQVIYHFSISKFFSDTFNLDLQMTTTHSNRYFNINEIKLRFYDRSSCLKENDNYKEIMSFNFQPWLKMPRLQLTYSIDSWDIILNIISDSFEKHDEFFRNIKELLQLYNSNCHYPLLFQSPTSSYDSIITVITENNLNLFSSFFEGEPDLFNLFIDIVSRVEILNHNVIFRFILKSKKIREYLRYSLQNYTLMETDCIISFQIGEKEDIITLYSLSKLKILDTNPTKKVFKTIIPNFLRFFNKLQRFIKISHNNYFIDESTYILTPLYFQFKYKHQNEDKTITVQLQADAKTGNAWKVLISPNELHFFEYYYDHSNIFNEECNFISHLKHYFCIDHVYQLLTSRFVSYMTPSLKITLSTHSLRQGIFVLLKDYNTFEIFVLNKYSFFIEVITETQIDIYSNYSNNPQESMNILSEIVRLQNKWKEDNSGKIVMRCPNLNDVTNEINYIISVVENYQPSNNN